MSSLTDIRGIGPALAKALKALGIASPELLARADPSALTQVRGISTDRAQGFIDAATALGEAPSAPEAKAKTARAKPEASGKKGSKKKADKKADKKATAKKADAKAKDKKADAKKTSKKKDDKKKAKKKSGKAAKKKSKKKKKSGTSKK